VTSIVNANITDERVFTVGLGGVTPAITAARPTNPYDGMPIYASDLEAMFVASSSAWKFLAYTKTFGGNVQYTRTTTLNITNITNTVIPFSGASPDTDVDVVASASNTIFTMQRTGKWLWIVTAPFGNNGGGNGRWLWIHQGGNPNVRYATVSDLNAAPSGNHHMQAMICRRFTSGDSISAAVFHDSGATLQLNPDPLTGPCNIYGQYLGS